ncbi:putative ankyrin repeat-containing domain-containing protein [Rosa chinensis]|uniref:Putative ankyrin repeat-containing domain-containing protein n=1 Tax=Rosa chinensis TaxID=74649 RepID=A0A2P6SHY5_ROSCH|nr:putative ankyrin repeat-containing domain-containing protein [Rosa chinensis]
MLAAMHGKISCVRKLLEVGANVLMFDSLHERTCLHYAAYYGHANCLQAIVSAAQSNHVAVSCCPGSTPLHLAARGGSLDCIQGLLAWGAYRAQRDGSGRMPYIVALKHKHGACAAMLNPSSAEPLVWPSPLKFISELNEEAKALLEQALTEANKEREKNILKGSGYSLASPSHSDVHSDIGMDDNLSEVISYLPVYF